MTRAELITLSSRDAYRSYLEIGVGDPGGMSSKCNAPKSSVERA